MKTNIFEEIAGWYGMLAIFGAYALVSFNYIASNGLVFQILNITGSLGFVFITLKKKVYQSVILNVVWALVGLVAIINILK